MCGPRPKAVCRNTWYDTKKIKGQKLSDGQDIGGRTGRLTHSAIDTLKNLYGLAARRNKNSLSKMSGPTDVWATFYREASLDKYP